MRVRVAGAIVLTIGTVATAAPGLARAADPGKQIAALQAIKRTLSPTERKLDSRLAAGLREGRKSGMSDVDIRPVAGADLVPRLLAAGAVIRYASPRTGDVRAGVPIRKLKTIAGWSGVAHVDEAVGYRTAHLDARSESKAERAARIDARLSEVAAAATVVSEGDHAHGADLVRSRDRVSGVGTKLCVVSDGIDSLAASQADGELGPVDVLPEQSGDGDEGTAMLEILHDLAPAAELGFATARPSPAAFADNILGLREAGCDAIVDDFLYYDESPFQDGPIAQAVNAVTADGALYFSPAGNEGNVLDGTSGNYESDFRGAGRGVGKIAGEAHDFDPGSAVQVFNPLSIGSNGTVVTFFWAEPLGKAASDYDLYLFNAAGTLIAYSQAVQDGDDNPYERINMPVAGGPYRLAVVRYAGEPRYFQLTSVGGRFKASSDGLPAWATPGVTRGHSAAAAAFSTAAAPAAAPWEGELESDDPPNPAGPFPELFTAAQLPERFTSDGPRRMFFAADGTPAPQVRSKPDIAAADGVTTSVSGFAPFFGTSASAPHAAAIAGLILSGNPTATEADVREAFNATALDLAPAGVDNRTGHGLVRADRALEYTGATPQPLVQAQAPQTPVTTDGDTYVEPGETATLRLPVTNVGDGTATGISVTVTTSDPQVTIAPRARAYGDLAAGATTSRDFELKLAADYPLGKRLRIAVRVTFAGVLSPTTATFAIAAGQPAATAQRFSYTGRAVAIPDDSSTGAEVTIPVNGVGYASKIAFSIDGQTCVTTTPSATVGLDHSFVSDLTATLIAPDGSSALLFEEAGSFGNNLCQVVFDDSATAPLASAPSSSNPFTGTWRPEQPLDPLLEHSVDGNWTFRAVDDEALDTGSIRAVSLLLTGFEEG